MLRSNTNPSAEYSNQSILECKQCGKYNIKSTERNQYCFCGALLLYDKQIMIAGNEINNCKMCFIIAKQSQ